MLLQIPIIIYYTYDASIILYHVIMLLSKQLDTYVVNSEEDWFILVQGSFCECVQPMSKCVAWQQQAITWANVNPDLCHHMASQGHNELM